MGRHQPWMKWYPSDWRAEPTLRMCRRQARSFWVDLLGLMHEAHRYGHLLVNGIKPSVEQIARLTGDSEREVRTWLAELEMNGVFSKTEDGIIYSRRMVRDNAKAQQDARNGKGGGNPKLRSADNGGVNPPDKAQIPEARDQKEESPSLRSGVARKRRGPLPELTELTPGLRQLADKEGRDADREFLRCQNWCADNGKRLTVPRFQNWLTSDYGKGKPTNGPRPERPRTGEDWLRSDPEFRGAVARMVAETDGGNGPADEAVTAGRAHGRNDRAAVESGGDISSRALPKPTGSGGGAAADNYTRVGGVDEVPAALGYRPAPRLVAGLREPAGGSVSHAGAHEGHPRAPGAGAAAGDRPDQPQAGDGPGLRSIGGESPPRGSDRTPTQIVDAGDLPPFLMRAKG